MKHPAYFDVRARMYELLVFKLSGSAQSTGFKMIYASWFVNALNIFAIYQNTIL